MVLATPVSITVYSRHVCGGGVLSYDRIDRLL